jgi:hypothetical protein
MINTFQSTVAQGKEFEVLFAAIMLLKCAQTIYNNGNAWVVTQFRCSDTLSQLILRKKTDLTLLSFPIYVTNACFNILDSALGQHQRRKNEF